jgi:chaperonin GroES
MKKLQPLHDRVLVKRINIEEQTKGGIFIPESAKEKPLEGEVIAAGPGRIIDNKRIPLDVIVGDRVLFAKYSETEVTLDNEKYLLLKEDDILGIIK